MTDYISREAVLTALFNGGHNLYSWDEIEDRLSAIPAADVREVVRCGECKHYYDIMYKGTQFEYGFCDRWCDDTRQSPTDFCSRGAKMEGE